MASDFLAMQGPMNTVMQPGCRYFRYLEIAHIGETVEDIFSSYCLGKCLRSMLMKAGQQDVVIFLPSLYASLHSADS